MTADQSPAEPLTALEESYQEWRFARPKASVAEAFGAGFAYGTVLPAATVEFLRQRDELADALAAYIGAAKLARIAENQRNGAVLVGPPRLVAAVSALRNAGRLP